MSVRLSFAITLVAVVFAPSAFVRAETILIDFGNANTAPASGGTWNSITDSTLGHAQGLVDSVGNATSITLTVADDMNESSILTNNAWSASPTPPSWIDNDALKDVFWVRDTNNTGKITLGGLNDGRLYNLEIAASRNHTSPVTADYKVQGGFTGNSNGFDAFNDAHVNHEIMVWYNVSPTAGMIDVEIELTGMYGYLNAMRLTAIPEPSTAMLGLIGMCGLLWWRRRAR